MESVFWFIVFVCIFYLGLLLLSFCFILFSFCLRLWQSHVIRSYYLQTDKYLSSLLQAISIGRSKGDSVVSKSFLVLARGAQSS